jgi:uncharacterized protein (DUF169 family)
MESRIAQALEVEHPPVAVLFADDKPEGAMQFAPGKWGCVMWLLATAAKGRPAVADRETFGCIGGGVGLGFGNQYESWPGGVECFHRFLSTGIEGWDKGAEIADQLRPHLRRESFEELLHGERYVKSPDLVRRFVDTLPFFEIPTSYVVFKPLEGIGPNERPETIVFLVDPDRLSALVVLANYSRDGCDNVVIPFAAGCQTVGIFPYREARDVAPKAVVGLTDLSARRYIGDQLGGNLMSFAVPFGLFEAMEADVEGSFLERPTWQTLLERRRGSKT